MPDPKPPADGPTAADATIPQDVRPVGEAHFGPPRQAGDLGTLGRYRVLKKLGQGGMGAVYLGFHDALGRQIALKVMLPQYAADADARGRFLREARLAAVAKSDHVVTIHDVDEQAGAPFIAMEYLLGMPLDQFLKTRGELPLEQVLRIGRETAEGLAAAHELGLIHRDIKPANIWLEAPKGRVKILDFGLARAATDDEHLTGRGAILGTPAFMSPEQARGLKVDHRTDLFSLGVMLYRLTTGKMPFVGSGTMGVLTALAVDTPVPPRAHNAHLPPAVEAVVLRLLAKNPAERFQTAAEVVAALGAAAAGPRPAVVAVPVPFQVAAQPPNVWEHIDSSESISAAAGETEVEPAPVPPAARQRPPSMLPLAAAVAAVLLAAGAVAAVLLWPRKKPDPAPPVETAQPVFAPKPPGPPRPKGDAAGGKEYPLPPDLVEPGKPVGPKEVFSLDHLDPARHIPPDERMAWLPPEVVAVLGSHHRRCRGQVSRVVVSPDGTAVNAEIPGGPNRVFAIPGGAALDRPTIAAYSPDGTRGAQGNRVYNLTEKTSIEYPAITGRITAFLAADVVLAQRDRQAVVWRLDPAGIKPLLTLDDAPIVAVSPGRKSLATVSSANVCVVYDITADGPKEKFALAGEHAPVSSMSTQPVTVSDAGRLVALAPGHRALRLWDVTGAAPRLLHALDATQRYALSFNPAGDRLAVGNNGDAPWLEVWTINGDRLERVAAVPPEAFRLLDSNAGPVAWTPDGATVVVGHANGAVRFWGFEKGTLFERNPLPPNRWLRAPYTDLSPDGRFATLFVEDARGQTLNLADLTPRPLVDGLHQVSLFGPTGAVLYTTGGGGNNWLEVRAAAAGFAAPVRFADGLAQRPACASPDGRFLATASDTEVVLWDATASPPKELGRTPLNGFDPTVWKFSADGRFVAAVRAGQTGSSAVRTWAITRRGPVPRYESDDLPLASAVAPAPNGFVFGDALLSPYDLIDGVSRLAGGRGGGGGGAGALAVSADGRLAAPATSGLLRVVNRATGAVLRTWTAFANPIGLRFHPDGRHLIVSDGPTGVTYVLRLPKEVWQAAADRRAAEHALARGGEVSVSGAEGVFARRDDLPAGDFKLLAVRLRSRPDLTDADLAPFLLCEHLHTLDLRDSPVTDAGLANFRNAPGLVHLLLENTKLTDAGLEHFKGCKDLEHLSLANTAVTDAGMALFKDCTKLTELSVRGTKVTPAGVAAIRARCPRCFIDILDLKE
jgi:WD40 repeat protein/predicted Ser/Thr protein kinase